MHELPPPSATETELLALRQEMKEWALGIRCVFAVLTVLPLYYCTRVLLAAPKFELIFEDMLGSKSKLPELTQFVLRGWAPLLVGVWLLAALAIVLIFAVERARFVWITAVFTAFVLIVCGHVIASVAMEPLMMVIQNLSGGGG